MLVLTRKANEQIQIGDQVVITILQVKGHSVRIGIDAPRDVLVLRAELPKHETAPDHNSTSTNHRAGLSSTRKTTLRSTTSSPRRIPGRGRPGSDARQHPDRAGARSGAGAAALRPTFLNYL